MSEAHTGRTPLLPGDSDGLTSQADSVSEQGGRSERRVAFSPDPSPRNGTPAGAGAEEGSSASAVDVTAGSDRAGPRSLADRGSHSTAVVPISPSDQSHSVLPVESLRDVDAVQSIRDSPSLELGGEGHIADLHTTSIASERVGIAHESAGKDAGGLDGVSGAAPLSARGAAPAPLSARGPQIGVGQLVLNASSRASHPAVRVVVEASSHARVDSSKAPLIDDSHAPHPIHTNGPASPVPTFRGHANPAGMGAGGASPGGGVAPFLRGPSAARLAETLRTDPAKAAQMERELSRFTEKMPPLARMMSRAALVKEEKLSPDRAAALVGLDGPTSARSAGVPGSPSHSLLGGTTTVFASTPRGTLVPLGHVPSAALTATLGHPSLPPLAFGAGVPGSARGTNPAVAQSALLITPFGTRPDIAVPHFHFHGAAPGGVMFPVHAPLMGGPLTSHAFAAGSSGTDAVAAHASGSSGTGTGAVEMGVSPAGFAGHSSHSGGNLGSVASTGAVGMTVPASMSAPDLTAERPTGALAATTAAHSFGAGGSVGFLRPSVADGGGSESGASGGSGVARGGGLQIVVSSPGKEELVAVRPSKDSLPVDEADAHLNDSEAEDSALDLLENEIVPALKDLIEAVRVTRNSSQVVRQTTQDVVGEQASLRREVVELRRVLEEQNAVLRKYLMVGGVVLGLLVILVIVVLARA